MTIVESLDYYVIARKDQGHPFFFVSYRGLESQKPDFSSSTSLEIYNLSEWQAHEAKTLLKQRGYEAVIVEKGFFSPHHIDLDEILLSERME